MNLDGEFKLPAAKESVWDALNDIEVLKECIPGCEELEQLSETELEASVRAKIGPVNAKFKTQVNLRDVNPPESYTLAVKSKGGAAGMGEGLAQVELSECEEGTQLKYAVDFKVQGKLAQIGSRLLMNVIQKMSNEFFSKFASHFVSEEEAVLQEESLPNEVEETKQNNKLVWIGVGILAAVFGVWLLSK